MALTVTNEELEARVGRLLGYGDTGFTGQVAEDVERCVADGKRNFYSPPTADGYQWSFLTPTRHFSLTSSVYRYDLPSDLAMLHGPIHFAIGSDEVRTPITLTSPENVQHNLQRSSTTGIPEIAAYRAQSHNEGSFLDGMRYELLVYPTPDQDYDVDLRYTINPLAPAGDNLLPIGDQAHAQTLIEACLAAAERFNGEGNGIHENEFQKRLAFSLAHDRKTTCPDTLGNNGDRSDLHDVYDGDYRRRTYGGSLVTYNGEVPS